MNTSEMDFTSSFHLFRRIGWAQTKAGEDWVRSRDLSHEPSFMLGFLVQIPGAIQRDIAQMARTSAASVSSLLQGLERSKRVFATEAGAELISGFEAAMMAADETILAPLDEAEPRHSTPCSPRSLVNCLSRPASHLAHPRRRSTVTSRPQWDRRARSRAVVPRFSSGKPPTAAELRRPRGRQIRRNRLGCTCIAPAHWR
jgi:MarR family transcriptional regulator, repressor for mepA